MVDVLEPMIDAPIAGQSLTAELGNRPWQQPPQYTTVEEALEFYVPRLTNPEMLDDLLNVMETGIPLTTLANAIQSSGVMEGKHSLDVGILIMPVLMETMAYLAEEAGIEYEAGTNKRIGSDKPSDAAVARALAMVRKKKDKQPEKPEEEQVEMELEEPSGGLMSRRNTDGV
tara:strand:- start:5307 stop:5822 length:516 start_codon:yes stop_codon:yes gene_type:complete